MTGIMEKIRRRPERLTEAYEVRAFRDESEAADEQQMSPVPDLRIHPDPEALQAAKDRVLGHGEQRVIPDDCEFGDNDLCNVEE